MQFLFSITWGTVSGWWAPACLALGVLYAWLLYRQPVRLDKRYRILVAVARCVVVSIIALVLLSPLVRSVSYNPQKPLVLVAGDNSQSVKLFTNDDPATTVDALSALKNQLGGDYDVREFHFNRDLADGFTKDFTGKQTDI